MLLSTTVALAFVCALAIGALKLLSPRRGLVRGMRIVSRLPLDVRRSLYVVEVGGRCLLLGAGDGPLTLLTELDPAKLEGPQLVKEAA